MKKLLIFLFFATIMFTSCEEEQFMPLTTSYDYSFHNGQTVPTAPYAGIHPNDFSATMDLEENEDGTTDITITLNNTIGAATYAVHAHDAADPATTPNGTPYNETPNSDIFAQQVTGNGSSVTITQTANLSYEELTTNYEGFFVVHDPLQAINTADISTYLVVGSFARSQTNPTLQSTTFSYDFNTGQVAPEFAYSGTHPTDLSATIQVDELADDRSRITIRINNTIDGEVYPTHAHDMADPNTTPNGTPYNETPNAGVFAMPIAGNGGLAGGTNVSDMSYDMITNDYDAFFVVHDPLQTITTVDPTTYVLLGIFAR